MVCEILFFEMSDWILERREIKERIDVQSSHKYACNMSKGNMVVVINIGLRKEKNKRRITRLAYMKIKKD